MLMTWLIVTPSETRVTSWTIEVLSHSPHLPVNFLPAQLFFSEEHHEVIQLPTCWFQMRFLCFPSEIDVCVIRFIALYDFKLRISQYHVAAFTNVQQIFRTLEENFKLFLVNSRENHVFLVMNSVKIFNRNYLSNFLSDVWFITIDSFP